MGSDSTVYVRFTGKFQGTFKGGVSRKNRGDNWFEVFAVKFDTPRRSVRTPPQGESENSFLRPNVEITKPAESRSFAAFTKAQSLGELLPLVEIELTKRPDGGTPASTCLQLTGVVIGGYETRWDPTQAANVDVIGLSFDRIESKCKDQQSAIDLDRIQGDFGDHLGGW
jgi:type VI protein secretion system component Hcp